MVENRPWLTVMSHAVLIAGILVISFPLYVTFVASTHTLDDILKVPMPLLPGGVAMATIESSVENMGSGADPLPRAPPAIFCPR